MNSFQTLFLVIKYWMTPPLNISIPRINKLGIYVGEPLNFQICLRTRSKFKNGHFVPDDS